jgi:formate hydrogenlyase transcriptional activator
MQINNTGSGQIRLPLVMPSGNRKAREVAAGLFETSGESGSGEGIPAYVDIERTISETEILRSLGNDIVKVRNKKDILTFIRPKLRLLFNTDDIFICFLDTLNETLNPVLRIGGPGRIGLPGYDRIVNARYPIYDGFIDKILDSNEPIVVDLLKLQDANECIRFFRTSGLVQSLSVRLISAGDVIGILTLWSETSDFFTARDKNLIAEIANQISLVVVNILANEEIAKREEEKSVLLSVSYKIAAVRNRNELLDLLDSKLKELFPIKGFGITLLDENGRTHRPFVVHVHDEIRDESEFRKVTTQVYNVKDGVFDTIIDSSEPVTLYVEQLTAMAEAPAYVYYWEKLEIREVVGVSVRIGETNLGCFILLRDHERADTINTNLLKGVGAQISVAISNILSNEEIANREKEKSVLLSISDGIAALRNRSDLLQIVNTKLKALFSVKEFGIAQIFEEETTYGAFALDVQDNVRDHPDFTRVTSGRYDVTDKIFSSIIDAEDPVVFDVDVCAAQPGMPDYVAFWKSVGLHQVIGMAMRAGGKKIGCVFLHLDSTQTAQVKGNMIKSVCAQLAVAVSNIIANEKVLDQLNEIKSYKHQLEQEKTYLKEEIEHAHNYSEIIGESSEIKKVFKMVTQVAYSDSTVLLLGETGTGKELIARAIHNASIRKNKLMIKVNCAALPANLIESELFGHERGSFTGAIERRIGKFELANHGTLFLDEIGEMPLDLQVKLLRALQEKEIERVGGKTTIKTDVRIIAATNRNLEKLMQEGKFRNDLYYRLNIFPIMLPSLRERREDILHLVSFFIVRYAKKAGKKITTISNKALQELMLYDWPGNIRELEHLIERSVLMATGDTIKEIHLPQQASTLAGAVGKDGFSIKTIDENEKEHILRTLKHVNGKIGGMGGAAELLGIPPSTLNSKIKRLGIKREHSG